MEDTQILIYFILPIVAFFYAAVGHGGASGYLALMALFSFSPEVMKPTALLLNLFVAAISFYQYWRAGHFHARLFIAVAAGSIPLSFIGGALEVDAHVYKLILGVFLLVAVLKMINVFGQNNAQRIPVSWGGGIFTGALIGFFSGLIGIGGGIILSPVILLFRWSTIRQAAAVSALFIWVNSAAGLAGQYTAGIRLDPNAWWFVLCAVVGGLAGGYFGSKRMNNQTLRNLLAFVLFLAALKLLLF